MEQFRGGDIFSGFVFVGNFMVGLIRNLQYRFIDIHKRNSVVCALV